MKLVKKTVALILAMVMMLSSLPMTAFAAENGNSEDSLSEAGIDGDFQYSILPDGTASICGYDPLDLALTDHGDHSVIYIPDTVDGLTVTALAQEALAHNTEIKAVFIPESVVSIENAAFYQCEALELVAFQNASMVFGVTAFEGCSALRSILMQEAGDSTAVSALLTNDLGTDHAVRITLYDSLEEIRDAFEETAERLGTTSGSASQNAETPIASGSCGDSLTWSLSNEYKLTISGTGAMENYSSGTAPWYAYREQIITLDLPAAVSSIGEYAFKGCTGLTGGLVIPGNVSSIGQYAFNGCTGLDGKLIIEAGTAKTIGQYAFQNCSKLTGLELGDGVTSIGESAFYGCSGMKGDLTIPDSVTSIGYSAFYGCSGFNGTLTLSKALTSLGSYAFRNCSGFTGELVIPDKLTAINEGTFSRMSGITSVVIGESVATICTNSYYDYYHCFNGMSGVTEVTFLGLTVPTISSSSPFSSMTKLETVYVPAGAYAKYSNAYKSYLPSTARLKSIGATGDFQIDDGVLTAYFGDGGEVAIPDTVTEIGTSAFQNCTALTKVSIPGGVSSIGSYAFKGCTGLTEVVFSAGLDKIGSYAFSGCNALSNVALPESLTSIGSSAFSGCTSLSKLTLPAAVSSIGEYAFKGCTGLTGGLVIPGNVSSIGQYAFNGCTGLDGKLIIEAGTAKTIGQCAFQNCSKLTGLELGDGITSIGESAFDGCSGMKGDLTIPDSVTSIGWYAFRGCSGLNGTLTLSAALTSLGSYAFRNCSGFTGELVIPDKLAAINRGVFYGMSGITSVVIGESVTSISTDSNYYDYPCFGGMSGVTEVTFLGLTVPTISSSSPFSSMTKLETVYVPAGAYNAYVAAYSQYVGSGVTFSSDTLHAKPGNLRVTWCGSKSVTLAWNSHANNTVIGYRIERDGVLVGTTDNCTFTDQQLTAGTAYTYTVCGYTADGAITAKAEISITPQVPRILDIKTGNIQNKLGGDQDTVYIYVQDSKNLRPETVRTIAELYYLDNGQRCLIGQGTLSETLSSFNTAVYTVQWDVSTMVEGDYEVVFCLTDADGVQTEYSKTLAVDHSRPAQIVGVTAISDIQVIHLTWAISSEADTTTYRIYRRAETDEDFRLIAQIKNRNTLTYTDKNVKSDHIYHYYVTGTNSLNRESEPSLIVGATLSLDEEAPRVTKLTPANGSYLTGTISIGFTAEDNVSVTQGELYYSLDKGITWTLLGEGKAAQFNAELVTTNLPDGVIQIKGIAYDAAGNESDPFVNTYFIDNTGPEQVRGLVWETTSVTATLHWQDVADEDISFYRVERLLDSGAYSRIADVNSTLGANLYDLAPDTEYTYRVVGYDIHGNRGTSSETVTVRTQSDTTAPVVTRIRPTSGYYSANIDVTITATDEYNVESITLQTSQDAVIWADVYTETYSNANKSRTMSYKLALEGYEEGILFIRGVATDQAGNLSDAGRTAPFVQHIVDRTAPGTPENVAATSCNGYNEVTWTQGEESDLGTYAVYRSTSEEGTYTLLKSGIQAINFIDRTAEAGRTYYYKVNVNDTAGNVSAFSAVVSAASIPDTEVPQIVSIYPQDGSTIGSGYRTVSVLVSDNSALDYTLLEYSRDGESFTQLVKRAGLKDARCTISADLPLNQCGSGDIVYLRVTACDKAGNISETVTTRYTVDMTAPAVCSVVAEYQDEGVSISWTGNGEADLIGYRIYRKIVGSDTYSLIAQRQVTNGESAYHCNDYNLPLQKTSFIYKVEAVDAYGNTSSVETGRVDIPDRSAPTPGLSCEATQEVGVEYVFDATSSRDNSAVVSWHIDFGDGSSSSRSKAIHVYPETGIYTVTLTVTDDDGNQAVLRKNITVKERTLIGTAKIRIVDENGTAVSNAPVYFDLGEETQVIKPTDNLGYVTFTTEVGKHTVGCVIPDNQWLPVKKDVIITAGSETSVSMTLIRHVMIEGAFEITRMTFEEIAAAGIDVSAPENQYMVKVNVTLAYGEEKVETSFTYNETTGTTIAKPTIVSTPDGEKRQIVPVVISTGSHGSSGSGGDYNFSKEACIAYLDVPVGVSSLKEFFNVNLHIINNAAREFSMKDNVVTLNVPKGLTLMDTYKSQNSPTVAIAEIKGQTTETITWILRGDEVGKYYLTADYSGILSQFNEIICTQFVASEPIEVYGLSNLKLRIEIPEELDHGTFYYNTALSNEGTVEVYRPRIDAGGTLIETQLFNENGSNIVDKYAPDAGTINDLGLATSVTGELDTLLPGYQLIKHYMCVTQTSYTDQEQKLKDFAYDVQNSYGLAVEIVKKPLSYFKSNLGTDINAKDKADRLSGENQSAYDYLMTNENYVYWSMYASTGEVATALTTPEQEDLWNLLAFAAGSGDFKSLFGLDDEERIEALLLDMMELNIEKQDFTKYYAICDWTKMVSKWAEDEGYGEWVNTVAKWVKKKGEDLSEEQLSRLTEQIGESLPHTFELIAAEYKWEVYQAVYEGEYLDLDRMILEKWQVVYEETYFESLEIFTESERSRMLHELFSAESFKKVWDAAGFGLKLGESFVKIAENTATDISIFFAAQSNLESCDLFLQTVSNYMPLHTSDAGMVADVAKKLKDKINEIDIWERICDNLTEEAFWTGIGYAKKAALKKLDLTPNLFVQSIKAALKLTEYVGNNVFNVSERHDIANNIRYVSCITTALQRRIDDTAGHYSTNKTEECAKTYMQLISYLLDVRAIGESQVATFGMTYEVLPGVFDSKELFLAIKGMSGAESATSWIEWRDIVEDRISLLRVQLLKNPVTQQAGEICAPVVTFDYTAGQTAQKFSSEYEYSLNGGTWTPCDGSAIPVQTARTATLEVRRIDRGNTNEKLTGLVTIYAPPSLSAGGIRVLQTETGYRVEGLDNSRKYEVTFSAEAISYNYDDSLRIAIPAGSYSYDYVAMESCDYVYIRSLADTNRFASYVYRAPVYPMAMLTVTTAAGHGVINGTGRYEYGSQATLVATPNHDYEFSGWYDENGQLLCSDSTVTLTLTGDRSISAKFNRVSASWITDDDTGLATGFVEKLSAAEVVAFYKAQNKTASITNTEGESVSVVATGYRLTLDGETYSIVVSGDTNGDGSVSVLDMACLYTFLTQSINEGNVKDGTCFLKALDVNRDAHVNVYDLQRLYEEVSGIGVLVK